MFEVTSLVYIKNNGIKFRSLILWTCNLYFKIHKKWL